MAPIKYSFPIIFLRMRKYFNMIEVTLAIVIVSLGLVGIMALFPVGMYSSRDALGDNYVNDASQLFLTYIKLRAKQNTITPPSDQTQADINTQWNNTMASILTTKPDSTGSGETSNPLLSGAGFSATEIPGIYYHNPSPGTPIKGLFRVYPGNANANDFKAAVRIWRKGTNTAIYKGGTPEWTYYSPPDTVSCALYIEFSWPVEKPYDRRTKRYFYYELFKPQLQ